MGHGLSSCFVSLPLDLSLSLAGSPPLVYISPSTGLSLSSLISLDFSLLSTLSDSLKPEEQKDDKK
jgi:hypothetical protein